MASGKKRRKNARQARKARQTRVGPFRHPDGDRRRRGGLTADEALARKRALQQLGEVLPPTAQEEE
jgi:hypothetical protein